MQRTTTKPTQAPSRYWDKRLRSPAFKRALTDTLARELHLLAKERVADVVDAERIRTAIREWDTRLVDRRQVAELIIQTNRHISARLSRRKESLLDLLDRQVVADIERLLTGMNDYSAQTEAFVGDIMRQEFVRRLFTDIVFTSIVSFNRKVNPIFGGLTMRMLEDQIKGFIRLFMPMLVEQATAFAISPQNQRLALDFARQIIRQLLDQPLRNFVVATSPARRKQVEDAIRKAVTDARLQAVMRQVALDGWNDFYDAVHNRRIGELIRLEQHADWLAAQCVEAILPVLARPGVVQLIAGEAVLAAKDVSPGPSPKRRGGQKRKHSVPLPPPGRQSG